MPTRYLFGLLLLLLGVGYLLDQFYPGLSLVGRFWPALILLYGLNELFRRPRHPWWPLLLLVIGVLALWRTMGLQQELNPWAVIGAALLIGLGLRLLLPDRQRRRTVGGETTMVRSENSINQSVTFGGAKIHVRSQQFRGGRVSAVFAGVEIDLREANLAPDGAELQLDVMFGGIEIKVPVGWPLEITGAPAFGACEAHVQNAEIAAPGSAALRIHCSGAFGGVEIKN